MSQPLDHCPRLEEPLYLRHLEGDDEERSDAYAVVEQDPAIERPLPFKEAGELSHYFEGSPVYLDLFRQTDSRACIYPIQFINEQESLVELRGAARNYPDFDKIMASRLFGNPSTSGLASGPVSASHYFSDPADLGDLKGVLYDPATAMFYGQSLYDSARLFLVGDLQNLNNIMAGVIRGAIYLANLYSEEFPPLAGKIIDSGNNCLDLSVSGRSGEMVETFLSNQLKDFDADLFSRLDGKVKYYNGSKETSVLDGSPIFAIALPDQKEICVTPNFVNQIGTQQDATLIGALVHEGVHLSIFENELTTPTGFAGPFAIELYLQVLSQRGDILYSDEKRNREAEAQSLLMPAHWDDEVYAYGLQANFLGEKILSGDLNQHQEKAFIPVIESALLNEIYLAQSTELRFPGSMVKLRVQGHNAASYFEDPNGDPSNQEVNDKVIAPILKNLGMATP